MDVALAGDRSAYVGLIGAAASSARVTTHLRFWIFVADKIDVDGVDEAGRCAAPLAQVRVVYFDAAKFMNYTVRAPVGASYGNLRSPANFARFYLANLLPRDVDTVVYLDTDVIVRRDLTNLLDDAQPGGAVAAVPRPNQRPCFHANASRPGMFYCDHPALAHLRHHDLEAFNAGVTVFSLRIWRQRRLVDVVDTWLRKHDLQGPLWRLGSNPPLVLAALGSFTPLDPRWNCDGLAWKKTLDLDPACLQHDAFVWHWSGPKKPWLPNGHFKHLWWAHLPDARCLTHLPPAPTPADDSAPRRRRRRR